MSKLAVRLMGVSLLLGASLGLAAVPAVAQDSGVANTAEDFPSADAQDGFLGSGTDIWDLFHRAGQLSGGAQVNEGFYRSQSRRINREAESLRARQQAILEQQAAEAAAESEAEAAGVAE